MIVVVGMVFEARIAAGLGARVICGGDGHNLAPSLTRAMAAGCGGVISFGVAGGLAPDLKPGTCVIGSSILDDAPGIEDAQAQVDRRAGERHDPGLGGNLRWSVHRGGTPGAKGASIAPRAARATLVRGSALLGPGLGLLDAAPRRPAIALAREFAAPADA